jgi:hypothetical protein
MGFERNWTEPEIEKPETAGAETGVEDLARGLLPGDIVAPLLEATALALVRLLGITAIAALRPATAGEAIMTGTVTIGEEAMIADLQRILEGLLPAVHKVTTELTLPQRDDGRKRAINMARLIIGTL